MQTAQTDKMAIKARDITKVYGDGPTAYKALKGVDFDLESGEFVMLVGPSGSGKTTLLSIMGGVLSATGGRLEILGQDVTGWGESKLAPFRLSKVGFIFQGHNLIAALTNVQNISLGLELRGYKRREAERIARELLERLGVGESADRKPSDISGGQRQRVAIARAVAGGRELILADEPTASLDASSGLLVTELLKELAREQGTSVIIVTHDNRIYHLADRIVSIEDGLIASTSASPSQASA